MAYEKTTWVNNVTPVNATNMNKIENGIKDLDDNINSLKGRIEQTLTDSTTNIPTSSAVKNYVDNRHGYSTEEKVIGTFLGKPLYSKFIELGAIGKANTTNRYDLTGVYEKIKDYTAYMYLDNTWLTIPIYSSSLFAFVSTNCPGDGSAVIKLERKSSEDWHAFNLGIVIEYTKSTD